MLSKKKIVAKNPKKKKFFLDQYISRNFFEKYFKLPQKLNNK